jgi:signal transduction histidine kinase
MDLMAIPLRDQQAVQVSRFKPVFSNQSLDPRYRKRILAFQSDAKLNVQIGEVEFARGSEPHVHLAVRIDRYPGQLLGALFADVDLRYVTDVISAITIGKNGYAYIVTNTGDLIAHPDMSLVLGRANVGSYSQVKLAFENIPPGRSRQSIKATNFRSEKVFSSFARIPGLNWAVIIEQPVGEINETIYAILLRTSGLILLGLGIALFASVFVARRILRPLEVLGAGVQRIGRGDLEHRLEIKTGDELETLADEFNKMTNALKLSYSDLEKKVQQRTKELTALLDVTASATRSLDLNSVLHASTEKISEIFAFDATRIFLFDRTQTELQLVAENGMNTGGLVPPVFLRGQGVVGKVADSGEAVIFSDVRSDPGYESMSSSKASRINSHNFLAVFPIKSKDRTLGVITCLGKDPRRLAPEEIRLVTTMADQIGPAVDNLNLFEQIKEKTAELEKTNDYLLEALAQQTAVASTLRVMAGSLSNTQAVFDAILSDASRLTRATGGVIRLLDKAGTLRFVAHDRHGAQSLTTLQNTPLPADENGAATRAIREMRPLQINDIQREGPEWRGPVEPGPWHTAAAVPLLQENEAIGAIVVFRDFVEPFTDQQIELLTTFADQAVVAIKNATLFRELQERTRDLETANDRLTHLDKLKSGFLSNVSHELRTPLTAIGSLVENMLDGVTGALNDKQSRYISGIKDSTERLDRLIHDLLDLSVIESGRIELKMASFSLPSLMREVAHVLGPVAEKKSITLALPPAMNGDHFAWADRDKITQVLTNLISNAVKFTPAAGKVALELQSSTDGQWLQVGVSDTGPGIAPAEAKRIFDEFYQINQPGQEKAKGVGLGLAICKKLVDMHGGQIRVESAVGHGSTFYFTVPAHRKMFESTTVDSVKA